ncbi:hypothetical protein EVAR_75653_1 [Eumeta japonica]|uniref:Uncharacterized protein n=1 Tax=Eumeta variegata TaxID=151549 RepID=A0A4C1U013_EUMVA|nr:hypothetical protein EVAR_75653_1 [Eumeta japonica]
MCVHESRISRPAARAARNLGTALVGRDLFISGLRLGTKTARGRVCVLRLKKGRTKRGLGLPSSSRQGDAWVVPEMKDRASPDRESLFGVARRGRGTAELAGFVSPHN